MPIVSIIVPIYNTAAYLPRCIESLVNQTYSDLQIILIDDGSTDNSGAMADEWQAIDSRIEVYHQSNRGQSAARNVGLQHAKGEYIAFVDSDDYIDSNYFSTMLQVADATTDCVQTGYRRVKQDGEIIKAYRPKHFYQYTSPCMRLYRREFMEQHHLHFPEGMIYEDVVFSIDLWLAHPAYKMVSYCGYNYTLNTSSTTSRKRPQAEKALYRLLTQRWKAAASITNRLLIAYTMIRLKIHFYMPHDYKQYIRFILLFCLLLLPNIATAFLSIDLNYSVIKQLGYLLIVFVLLLIPLLFLKTKPYFIVEGIFNFLLSPIEFASLYLNKQSTTPLFIKTILSTNFGEAQELLQSFWWVVAIVIVGWILYCCLLVKIPNVSLLKGKYKTYAFAFCGAVLFCVYIGQFFLIRHIMPTKTLRASFAETNSCFLMKFEKIFPCNIYIGAYAWYHDKKEWKKAQQQVASFRFGIQPRQDMTSACYILYIGEAARYDHFQVNGYHRPTTPYLDTCSNILSFSNIYAQANLTGYSVPFILTRATPSNPEIIYQEKSIVEAFSEAGYQTAFVEKNASSPFIMRILNTCDYHFLYSSGIDGNANYDTEMLVNVKEAYSDKAQMMVLHGLGSHFKYSLRYPASEAYFLPAMTARDGYNASEANKESIINAYDNTIRYTDKALGELIEWGKYLHRPVVILYLSDHGESLWDDERKLALHGSYQMAEAEYHIPFIIWYSDEYATLYPNKVANLRVNQDITQTSGIAFHTLLDIADIHEAADSTQSACSPYIITLDSFPVWNGKGETVTYFVHPNN